jgi:hypothetical protein
VPFDAEDVLASGMAAAQNGDVEVRRLILRRCVAVVTGVAPAYGFRDAVVEDIVQEAPLTVHRVRHSYDPGLYSCRGCAPACRRRVSPARAFAWTGGATSDPLRDLSGPDGVRRVAHRPTGTPLEIGKRDRHVAGSRA